jgi:hypothetical protein
MLCFVGDVADACMRESTSRWVDLERMTASELFNLRLNNNPKGKKIGRWFRATQVACVLLTRSRARSHERVPGGRMYASSESDAVHLRVTDERARSPQGGYNSLIMP